MAEETTETTETPEVTETTTVEATTETTATGTPAETDWKTESRKHERRAKQASKELEQAQAKLKELEEQGASEHEKAVAKAREEAKAEALAEVNNERRSERLEAATTRFAATGIKVKITEDGEEVEKTIKFADPDDALVYVERAIKGGDVDEDDIFNNEGKVQTEALQAALKDILERKPHLQATTNGTPSPSGGAVVSGSADGGKGSSAGKDEESLSVDDRFKRIQRTK